MPYATGLYFIDMNRLVEEAVEEALEFKNDGFRAIKMKIGLGDLKLDTKRVARGARGDRPGRQARGRRQPLLLRAQRHQARPHAGGARHPVVRGADQPRGS